MIDLQFFAENMITYSFMLIRHYSAVWINVSCTKEESTHQSKIPEDYDYLSNNDGLHERRPWYAGEFPSRIPQGMINRPITELSIKFRAKRHLASPRIITRVTKFEGWWLLMMRRCIYRDAVPLKTHTCVRARA